MLAAALGMERTEPLDRFAELRFGVRIDQPGHVERDFQTTRSLGGHSFPLSQRYYLADAVFLVGVEATRDEVIAYRDAIARPYFPLFLGRRAFPPAGPIRTDIVESPLREALREASWRAKPHHQRSVRETEVSLAIVSDATRGEGRGESRQDVPLSFDPRRRQYASRDIIVENFTFQHPAPGSGPRSSHGSSREHLLGSSTEHDPWSSFTDEEV